MPWRMSMTRENRRGTRRRVNIVETSNPPTTTEPSPRYISEPDPGTITRGSMPPTEVRTDMRIGRVLVLTDSPIASMGAMGLIGVSPDSASPLMKLSA